MGNKQDKVTLEDSCVEQFISQAYVDWNKQMKEVYSQRPTLTKTVILPPGVELNDPRLKDGVVVAERKYQLDPGEFPSWPSDQPFECDVDGRLLPPCFGQKNQQAHFAVYPNKYFPELHCGYCDLKEMSHPLGNVRTVVVDEPKVIMPDDETYSRNESYLHRKHSAETDVPSTNVTQGPPQKATADDASKP